MLLVGSWKGGGGVARKGKAIQELKGSNEPQGGWGRSRNGGGGVGKVTSERCQRDYHEHRWIVGDAVDERWQRAGRGHGRLQGALGPRMVHPTNDVSTRSKATFHTTKNTAHHC